MTGISKKLTTFEKDVLLKIQNDQRKKYGLRPLKNLRIETLINLTSDKNDNTTTSTISDYEQEEMYQ